MPAGSSRHEIREYMTCSMKLEVPPPDYDNPKEVWAFFGLAAYSANLIEQSLVNLAAVLRLPAVGLVPQDMFERTFQELDKKTLGQLLRAAREIADIPDDLDGLLRDALDKRNSLIHSFFWYHREELLSETGCHEMINELREMIASFVEVDRRLEEVYLPLWEKHGVDEEFIRKELDQAHERARTRDTAA